MRDSFESILYILVFFVFSFVLALLINSFFLNFAKTLGIRNKNDVTIRWSAQSKPSLGGISFYIIFLFSFIFYAIIFGKEDVFQNKQILGLFFSLTLAFLLGLSDDAYNTRPFIKLGIQILCGMILVFTDNSIQIFGNDLINQILTVTWVVGLMNSINMLDNMDGITTITSMGIILSIIAICIPFETDSFINIFLLISIYGALSGFLFFNFSPSKMFMGDTGSQFLGMFLAYFSIVFLWNSHEETLAIQSNFNDLFKSITILILFFLIPLIDTTTVTINRILKGQSPMKGGKDHTTHHLVYKGFTEKQVAFLFILISLVNLLVAVIVKKYLPSNSLIFVIVWVYIIFVFVMLFGLTRKQRNLVK